jgi:iron complex outermembrane recepter protein
MYGHLSPKNSCILRNIKNCKSVSRKILPIILFVLSSLTGFTQKITAVVLNEDSSKVGACSISLINISTKKIIKLTTTNNQGAFSFENIQADSFKIDISHVGYANFTTAVFVLQKDEIKKLGNIILQKSKNNLSEVVVTSKRQMLEVKADKMVVNVEGTINAVGSDALELIRKSPGVAVDKDENIQMSGKSGVQIYIDGKPSPLSGEDLANYLKSVQSSQIDALELITNPSAKYEAAGNAGIINIRLKKNRSIGTNGSVLAGYAIGVKSKYNGGFNINNRTKNVNVFANYNYSYLDNRIDFKTYRKLADTTFDLRADRGFLNKTHGFKTGIDIFQNKTTTWGFLVTGNLTNSNPNGKSDNVIIANNTNTIIKILESNSNQIGSDNNVNFNANYKYANAKNRVLNIDADFGTFKLTRDLYQPNIYYDATKTNILNEVNYNLLSLANINIYSFKTDYEQPFAKGTIGIGGKFSYVTNDNNFKRYDVLSSIIKILDVSKSNQYNYRENVNALYVNYNRNWKNIQLQAGLRTEQTYSSGTSYAILPNEAVDYNSVKKFNRNYINLFPSAGISFVKNPISTWNITAGRRVDRPNYQDLNPFEFKIDEYSSRRGNTELIPQFSYNVAVTNAYKNKLISKLSFSNVTNFIGRVVDTAERSKSFISPRNIASQNIIGLFESYQYSKKWYTGVYTANAFFTNFKADFGGGNRIINTKATAVIVTMQNSFKLIHDWTVELNGNYNSPTVNAAAQEKVKWGIDIGAQKLILKGQGNIKFSATDIFWTNYDRSLLVFGAQVIEGQFKRESRQFKLNLTYRFGNNQIKSSRNRASGLEEELKRTQGGG